MIKIHSAFKPLAFLALSCLVATGCSGEHAGGPGGGMPPPPTPEVVVAKPTRDNLMDYEECTGRTEAFKTVDIRARVTGYLLKWNFAQGKKVKKGDILFEIDPRSYDAELARTEAAIVQAEAHLTRLNADYQRGITLTAAHAMGREDLDKIVGDRAEAVASVGIAKAVRDLARLNVDVHEGDGSSRRHHRPADDRRGQPRQGRRHHPHQHCHARSHVCLLRRR